MANGLKNYVTADPKNFLFVSLDALISDIAWKVRQEGHNVKYFIEEKGERDVGDGFVEKVGNWKREAGWADVIVFDDVLGEGKKAQKLREQGKHVVGGTAYTDMLEDERAFGQQELRKYGIHTLPSKDYSSFEEAIEFVKANPGRYVIKPSGEAQNLKGLLFVGEEEDGRDVIQVLGDYHKAWAKKIPRFQLQKRVVGVEIAVGAFFNGNEFIYPINVNFEHKKLFPGNLGPSTGEMGCYDHKTEVLTKEGWKFFSKVKKGDEFLTVGKEGFIEYQKPTDIIKLGSHKKLLRISNQAIDLAVTLNHNMYGLEANKYRKGDRKFGFVMAKDLPSQFVVPRTAKWDGTAERAFFLPECKKKHREGRTVVERAAPCLEIAMDDWLRFLGFYVAEGSCSKGYKVSIACSKNREEVKEMLARLPFSAKAGKEEFYIYSKQLWNCLRGLGKAGEKHVPEYVKGLSGRQIGIFLEWHCKGDGNLNNGFRVFYTSSKKLADGIQELLLKTGKSGTIKKRERKGGVWIKDHWAKINHPQYEIHERVKKNVSWLDKRDMEIVPYNKDVYCVTVPNHTLYVRRNGKPSFCGNTSMFWSGPNRIFNQTLKKLEPKLAEEKYVGYMDLNCIVNKNGIYPLEFTARFGYPTISIQQEGMITPIGEFLYQLAKGEKPMLKVKDGFQAGVRIVVPPFPFRDKETFRVKSKDSIIYFKKPTEGVHIEDVKIVNGEWIVTGTSGVVLIVCGTGLTMKQAQHQAYNRIKNIMIPNMYYRTDIGDRWYDDSDKLHNWGYLREL